MKRIATVVAAAAVLGLVVTVMAAKVYSYNDPKVVSNTWYATVERHVDSENGVVCYTATKGGLGISISCLQTR